MLDAAVQAGVEETDDLDWKSELPPAKGLSQTDFPKDVAAMANSGGGVIIYGVRESQKAAQERVAVDELDERYESAMLSAAISAISPPVFGLGVHRLGDAETRAVVVEVPASVDGPHLIYKHDYFAAPVRNGADTVWMKERQIEAMYRARFEERRHAREVLDSLYAEAAAGRDSVSRTWLIAVAHPRVPRVRSRMTRDAARSVIEDASHLSLRYAARESGAHPFESLDRANPRPGLRRWVAVNTAVSERTRWREAWASIHDDGSITLAAAIGGHPMSRDKAFEGGQVRATAIECGIADAMALLRKTARATGHDEYNLRVGVEWTGTGPLTILTIDNFGDVYDSVSTPLHRYTPVETTLNAAGSDLDYHQHVHDLAQDCVNQGGISNLRAISLPERDIANER
ncbi:AlbA family DNA-binding domain-containing protein [Salana multivorans]